jgi:hypothetical protein
MIVGSTVMSLPAVRRFELFGAGREASSRGQAESSVIG